MKPETLKVIREIIIASSDSHAAVQPLLPTQSLVKHSAWMQMQLRKAVQLIDLEAE